MYKKAKAKIYYIAISFAMLFTRACLDQLLIAIRLSLIVCDHVRSKTRLIVIIRLVAELRMIYTTPPYNGILSIVSLPPHSARLSALTDARCLTNSWRMILPGACWCRQCFKCTPCSICH